MGLTGSVMGFLSQPGGTGWLIFLTRFLTLSVYCLLKHHQLLFALF